MSAKQDVTVCEAVCNSLQTMSAKQDVTVCEAARRSQLQEVSTKAFGPSFGAGSMPPHTRSDQAPL